MKGIDVSRWQGQIDWPQVKKSDCGFAIIKIGGSDQGFYTDGMALRNVLEARACGMPIAFYVYLGGAFSPLEEVQHIKNLISHIGGLKAGEFVALDWEEAHSNEVSYVFEIAKGLKNLGFPAPPIYMSLSRVQSHNWRPLVDLNCGLWVAAWGNNDDKPDSTPPSDEWPFWMLWQFSSVGNVSGIRGKVDLNLFNGDAELFKKYGAGGNVAMPTIINIGTVITPNTSEYTIIKGDSLSSIAARFGKNWQQLYAINRDRVSDPNKIFAGQRLRIPHNNVSAPAPTAQHTAPQPPAPRTHTVVNGENLSVIAAKYGLSNWIVLFEANRNILSDPNLIKPGQQLRIP